MSKSTPNLKINALELQTALPAVTKVVNKNATLPVLQAIYMACDLSGNVTLAGTDLETGVTVRVASEVATPFATCVPGATFASLVAATDGTLEFTYDEASATLHMKSQGTKSKIKCIAGDEFPPLAVEGVTEIGKVPTSVLKSILKGVVIASSVDESRPTLMGVQLANINGVTTLTAADGFRLATYRLSDAYKMNFPTKKNDKDAEKEVEAIIPRAAVLNLIAALPTGTNDVTISMTENTIVFEWDKTTVRTQLVAGQFPDWPGIFPATWKHEITVARKEFQSAVKRAEIFARETVSHVLRFEPGEDGGLTIAGEDAETGRGETFLEGVTFPLDVFGLNVSFTRQGLEAIEGEKVTMRLNARNAPTVLTNGSDAYRYLVMPMHLDDKAAEAAAAAAVAAADEVQQTE
jgi:DNA polymerase III subunit beta